MQAHKNVGGLSLNAPFFQNQFKGFEKKLKLLQKVINFSKLLKKFKKKPYTFIKPTFIQQELLANILGIQSIN